MPPKKKTPAPEPSAAAGAIGGASGCSAGFLFDHCGLLALYIDPFISGRGVRWVLGNKCASTSHRTQSLRIVWRVLGWFAFDV